MGISNAWWDSGGTAAGSLPTEGTASGRNRWRHVLDFRHGLRAVPRSSPPPRCCCGQASAVNLNSSRLNKTHKGLFGSQHRLTNNHERSCGAAEDWAGGGTGSPRPLLVSPDFGSWNHSLRSPLHCTWGVRYTLSTYPRKPKDSLFSGTLSFILQCCGSLPHTSPTFCLSPKSRPLQLPLSCFNTDAFSAFPSSSICPVRSKQSSCHAHQSGSGLLLKLWAAALPLLHCSSQQPAPQTSGLTPFYLQSLISRSTSITSLNIVFT